MSLRKVASVCLIVAVFVSVATWFVTANHITRKHANELSELSKLREWKKSYDLIKTDFESYQALPPQDKRAAKRLARLPASVLNKLLSQQDIVFLTPRQERYAKIWEKTPTSIKVKLEEQASLVPLTTVQEHGLKIWGKMPASARQFFSMKKPLLGMTVACGKPNKHTRWRRDEITECVSKLCDLGAKRGNLDGADLWVVAIRNSCIADSGIAIQDDAGMLADYYGNNIDEPIKKAVGRVLKDRQTEAVVSSLDN